VGVDVVSHSVVTMLGYAILCYSMLDMMMMMMVMMMYDGNDDDV